jgi:hypothetical protein
MNTVAEIVAAILGVALIAVVLSTNANTSNLIGTFGQGFSGVLHAALSPVTG